MRNLKSNYLRIAYFFHLIRTLKDVRSMHKKFKFLICFLKNEISNWLCLRENEFINLCLQTIYIKLFQNWGLYVENKNIRFLKLIGIINFFSLVLIYQRSQRSLLPLPLRQLSGVLLESYWSVPKVISWPTPIIEEEKLADISSNNRM